MEPPLRRDKSQTIAGVWRRVGVGGGGEVKWQFVREYKSKFIMQSSLYNKSFAFGLFFSLYKSGRISMV